MKKKQKQTTDAIVTIDKSGNVYEKQAPKQKKTANDVVSSLTNAAKQTNQQLKQNTQEKNIKKQTQKIANKNYNEKLNVFNKASETYQKKRGEELQKRNVDLSSKSTIDLQPYKNKILSYSKKEEETKTPQQNLIERTQKQQPIINEVNKQLTKEKQDVEKARNDYVLAKYQKNLADVNNKDIGVYDKTLGAFVTGVQDIGSTFAGDNKYIDENGNTIYLPNKAELQWQKTRESYGDNLVGKLAKFGGDVAHEGGKIAATGLLNTATGGIGGSALYFSDIAADQYKQNINEGYGDDKAWTDALLKTGQNYIKQRLIGGLGGKLTGTGPSWLEKSLTNTWSKAVSNPVISKTLASMSSEAIDEFTDEWIESAIDTAVLGKKFDPMEVFKESLYSGAIGGATGAFGGMGERVTSSLDENRLALQELNNVADQRIAQIQQEVAQDPSKAQAGMEEIQDIERYVDAQTNIIQNQAQTQAQSNETTQGNTNTQETQNVAKQEKKEEIKENKNSGQEERKLVQKTTQKVDGIDKTGRTFRKMFFSDEKFKNLTDNEIVEYGMLKDEYDHTSSLPKIKADRVKYLNRKGAGLKNPELNPNIKSFEDIKDDYKLVKEHTITKDEKGKINKALDVVSANKQGRRTKEQWLEVANNIGLQSDKMDSESIKNIAFGSWAELTPNQKENLNRQGKKYVPLNINEWVKAVYEGAGVGEKIKENTVQTTQTETKQQKTNTEEKPKVETKKVTKMDIQYGDYNDPRIIVGRQASTAYNKTLDQYKMQVEYLTKDAKKAIEDYGGIEKLWKDAQTMSQVEIANNFGKNNETTRNSEIKQEEQKNNNEEKDGKTQGLVTNDDKALEIMNKAIDAINKNATTNHPALSEKQMQEMREYALESAKSNREYIEKQKKEKIDNTNPNKAAKVDNNVIAEKITKNINSAIKGNDIFEEIEKATGKPIRRGVKTITTATGTTELVSTMDGSIITYEPQANDKTLNKARESQKDMSLDEKYQDCLDFINSDKRIKAVDIAKIELTLQELQKAGEADKFSNLVQYASTLGTTDAQALQMMSVIKKMNPMTQLETLQKLIQKEQSRGNKIYDGVEIKQELVKKVLDSQKANGEVNQDQFYEAMEELKNDIAKQMKSTTIDKANAFRYIAMLGNPKTHIRNVVGNGFMFGLQSFKDVIGTIGEIAYDTSLKAQGKEGMQERTKTFKASSKDVRDFVNNKVDDFFKKNKMKNKYDESMKGLSGDLESRREIFSNNNIIGKALNKVSTINNTALDKMDKAFASSMTKKAMKNYLTANGIRTNEQIEKNPDMVARALDYALFKGKEATFHQDSTTASIIRNAREKAKTGSGFTKALGLGIDATMPFVSTPVNIAKNAMEYTPIVGFGDLNTQLKNSPKELRGAIVIDNLSKQFAGLSLLGLGVFLAATGKIKGAGEDDKEDKIEKNLGNAQYSVKWGKNTYDLSWISPSAVPLFEGVEIYNKYGKNKKLDVGTMVDTFFGALNPVTDMSVLQSIEKTLTSLAYGKNATQSLGETTLSSYLSQYIPTLSSQIAQWFDTKQRDSNTGSNAIEKTLDQIKYKIPGVRNTLPERVDIWGETNKTAENFWQRGFEAFLSPANRKDYKVDSTTKELERVARETGETSALPTERGRSQKIGGETIQLSGEELTDFKKAYGKNSKTQIDKLIKTKEYKNADDVTKKQMIADMYQYAIYEAKKDYGKKHNIEVSADAQKYALADAFNIPYYKLGGLRISDIKADKNSKGKSISGSAKKKAINLINQTDLTATQKAAIISQKWSYKYDSNEFNRIIDSSNLSKEDKEKLKEKLKS